MVLVFFYKHKRRKKNREKQKIEDSVSRHFGQKGPQAVDGKPPQSAQQNHPSYESRFERTGFFRE